MANLGNCWIKVISNGVKLGVYQGKPVQTKAKLGQIRVKQGKSEFMGAAVEASDIPIGQQTKSNVQVCW